MATNIQTDDRKYITQYGAARAVQPVDPVFLLPKHQPGVAPHFNTSLQIKNPAGTVFDHGTRVAHRESMLDTGLHAPVVMEGQIVRVRSHPNGFWSWAKTVQIEARNVVMHAVETGVNSLWDMLPQEIKNVVGNGGKIVEGLTLGDFKDAASEDLDALKEFLGSSDAMMALAETVALIAAQGIPVVGQVIGGAAAVQRVMGAVDAASGAVEEIQAMAARWSQPMTPEQIAAERKMLAAWILHSGMALVLAALGRAGAKLSAKLKSRRNSKTEAESGEHKEAASSCPVCRRGSPVLLSTGEKGLAQTDFRLPGFVLLDWVRDYRSGNERVGWFGAGWMHPLSVSLVLAPDALLLHEADGRTIAFAPLAVGQDHFDAYQQLTVARPGAQHWTVRGKDGTVRHFAPVQPGQWELPLQQVTDRDGHAVRLHYGDGKQDVAVEFDSHAQPPPRPRAITDSVGRRLLLGWTAQGLLQAVDLVADPRRPEHPLRLAAYRYDADGCLVETLTAGPQDGADPPTAASPHTAYAARPASRSYRWQGGVLVGYTLATGERYAATYDEYSPAGRVTRSWCEDTGEGLVFDYHPRAQTTRVTDALGRTTTYLWNARHDIVATIDPLGHRQDTPMDANGHLASTTDALGRSVSYQFDDRGNATTIVDAAGHATRLAYGTAEDGTQDLPVTLTDALGHTWHTAYDDRGHPVASTDPLGRTTRTAYDAQGLPVEIVDARGGVKRLDWTPRGELATYADCSGQRTFFDYDPLGRLVRSTDALGQERHYRYDAAGRLVALRQPDGGEQHYAWDAEGRLLAYTDPLGATTAYRYRAGGQPVERTDANGERLSYVYDRAGRLVQLVNENGALYRFGYDAADRLTDEIGFDGRHQRYGYNAAGELVRLIEAGGSEYGPGKVTRFARDVLGRLVAKRSEGDAACDTRYAYDPLGRLTAADNPAAQIAFAYDPAGQLLRETQTLAGIAAPRTLAHGYDPLGYRSDTTLPDGRGLHWLSYGSGHLHQIDLEAADGTHQTIADIGRDALHREVERSQGALTSRYGYDPMGRLVRHRAATQEQGRSQIQMSARMSGQPALLDRSYAYDAAGNLQGRSDNRRGVQSFAYDPVGRILAAHGGPLLGAGEAERFAFDPAGNLLEPRGGETSMPPQGAKVGDNRLRVWQDLRYEYDVHGNVIRRLKGAHTDAAFEWDAEHRLRSATVTRHGVTQQTHYRYDALGRRTHKEDAFGTTHYLWDGDLMVQSARQQKEALFVYEPGSFVPLATVQDGQTYWYQCDQIGAPLELTDAEGNIAWAADYKVWGEARVRETESKATGTYGNDKARRPTGHGPGWSQSRKTEADVLALQWQQQPVEQPFRLQGQQFDEETGLHYNRHRYYDPAVGRFVNQDPIGLAGGTNLFTYGPNANNWIDPAGLAGYIVLGEGQNGVDAYAKQLGLDRPGDSFKTISGEWQKITDKIPGELKPRTQEWTCAAAKANGDWIKEKAKEGYKFIIIGTDGQSVRSPFYKEELKALRESGIKPYDHSMKPGVSNARSSCFCPGKAKPKDRPNHQCD